MEKFDINNASSALAANLVAGITARDTLAKSLDTINEVIKNVRAHYKGDAAIAEFLKGSAKTNMFKRALTDEMLAGGLSKSTTQNYLSLIGHCIKTGRKFSFDLAKKLAAEKKAAGKPEAGKPEAGKPEAGKPEAGKPEATQIPPKEAPTVGGSPALTTGQVKDIANESGNNGPDVRQAPEQGWHQHAIVGCDQAVIGLHKVLAAMPKINYGKVQQDRITALIEELTELASEIKDVISR